MLQSLTIKSFAIIDQITIDFSKGMTVLSGETGAGKSIIIDALGILCGGRGSNEFIRQDSDKLVVEGLFIFDVITDELARVLADLSIDIDNLLVEGLIIRREITKQGKNIIRINGQLINVTQLKYLGNLLVDIHGQNEHQALLDSTQHLSLIDQLGDSDFVNLKEQYAQVFAEYQTLYRAWSKSQKNEQEQLQRLSFLEFQVKEIEEANLVREEYEQLEALSLKLQNASKISQSINAINYLFTDSEVSVLSQLNQIEGELSKLAAYDEYYPELLMQLKSLRIDLQEIAHQVAVNVETFDESDQSIDEIEARLSELGQLKRKYGMEINEIMDYYDEISEEIYQVRNREAYLQDLEIKLEKTYQVALKVAQQLSKTRQQLATSLIEAIEKELADLYMPNSRFNVEFCQNNMQKLVLDSLGAVEWIELTENGMETAEFYATTNIGEVSKPLVKVASGGELSRFMLALKAVFSRRNQEKVMVFDEIDTGVSGRVAQAIAEKIAQISQNNQVLCITHLAQVAAIAQEQLYIQKNVQDNRTNTDVAVLDMNQRVDVLAQMISGKIITASSKQMAEEMLREMTDIRERI